MVTCSTKFVEHFNAWMMTKLNGLAVVTCSLRLVGRLALKMSMDNNNNTVCVPCP